MPQTFGFIVFAFLIGFLGALAYYLAAYFNFIGANSRGQIRSLMRKYREYLGFYLMGGVVAAVFQAAQPNAFAPIQAFVLGATWPSVVVRMLSGTAGDSMLPKTVEELSSTEKFQDYKKIPAGVKVVGGEAIQESPSASGGKENV